MLLKLPNKRQTLTIEPKEKVSAGIMKLSRKYQSEQFLDFTNLGPIFITESGVGGSESLSFLSPFLSFTK